MGEHTPGDWYTVAYSSVVGGGVWSQPDPKENPVCVAMIPGPDRSTVEANARLIAAAPDMLDALQWAKAGLSAPYNATEGEIRRDALAAVNAALAKREPDRG